MSAVIHSFTVSGQMSNVWGSLLFISWDLLRWKRNIFKDVQNSLWVSYTLYRSRIEVSFLLFECSIYRTVYKI